MEFRVLPRIAGNVGCHNLRFWDFSNVYAKCTSGRARERLLPAVIAIIIASIAVSGLLPASVRASVDIASNVGVQIVARPGGASGSDQDFELRDGGVLRSGDGVQLRLESDADAYVYVVAYGSSGAAVLLHPFSGRAEDARMQPGQLNVIPGAGVFLPLDAREGRETLFTIVSGSPLTDVGDLLGRIEAHGNDVGAITAMIGAAYPGVRRLSFKHIGARPLVGVSATAARAATSPATTQPFTAAVTGAGGDASLLPPVESGWSVSSTQGFGTSDAAAGSAAASAAAAAAASGTAGAAAGTATAAAGTHVEPATSSSDVTAAGAAAGAAAAAEQTDTAAVSSALRKAREAAGIDESDFQVILATLPDGGQGAAPASLQKRYEEQGVLSGEGSRIRPLGSVQIELDSQDRSQN